MKHSSDTIINTKIEVPKDGAEGVIIIQGGRFAGWRLVMILDGKPA